MKYLKTMGLLAMLLSAFVSASSASAAEFHAAAVGTSFSGDQVVTHKFNLTGSTITCTTARFSGKTEALTSTTLKAHPDYSGCTAFGFVGATLSSAGCNYIFHANTGTLDLEDCTLGKLTITASSAFGKCVIDIPNQTGVNGQSFSTGGTSPSRDLIIGMNVTNMQGSVVTSTGICPVSVGAHVNLGYTGTTTVKPASGELYYT